MTGDIADTRRRMDLATILLGLAFTAIFCAAKLGSADCLGAYASDACRVDSGAFYLELGFVLIPALTLAYALRRLGEGGTYTRVMRLLTLGLALAVPALIRHMALLNNPQDLHCASAALGQGDLLASVLGQPDCAIVWHRWIIMGAAPGLFTLPLYAAIWAYIDAVRD